MVYSEKGYCPVSALSLSLWPASGTSPHCHTGTGLHTMACLLEEAQNVHLGKINL